MLHGRFQGELVHFAEPGLLLLEALQPILLIGGNGQRAFYLVVERLSGVEVVPGNDTRTAVDLADQKGLPFCREERQLLPVLKEDLPVRLQGTVLVTGDIDRPSVEGIFPAI